MDFSSVLISFYFLGVRISLPPMYGRNASGISTEPSACKLFSKKAINIRGGATQVLFKVCAKYLLPFSSFTRIFKRRACASVKLEQEPTSKYFCCLGDRA